MAEIPFPGGAADGDVFFHEDKVCVYHKAINTWECRTVERGIASGQPEAVTTQTVYTIPISTTNGSVNRSPRLIADLRTQYDVNWFIADNIEQLKKDVAFLEQQVGGLSKIFVGEDEPNNDYDQWSFWYKPVTGEFFYWDTDQDLWLLVNADRPPIFSDTEPTEHPNFQPPENELIQGDVWIDITDPDELIQYIYDGTVWVKTGGNYVHREGGDSMEGPLDVTGGRTPDADGIVSTVKVLNVDSGQDSDLQIKHNGNTKVYVGRNRTTTTQGIKFNQNNLKITGSDDAELFTMNTNGVFYEGAYTADKHIATKQTVEEEIYDDITDKDNTNFFVRRDGDSMSGHLEMTSDAGIAFDELGDNKKALNLTRKDGEYPVLAHLNHVQGSSNLGGYDINIGGNTSFNELRLKGGSNATVPSFKMKANGALYFYKNLQLDGNQITGLATATADNHAVPYGQVKQELQEFRDDLIQDLAFGIWRYQSGSVTPVMGRFYGRSSSAATSGYNVNQAESFTFNENDFYDNPGAWDRIKVGNMLTLTNGDLRVKYRINSDPILSGSSNEARVFDVGFISTTSAAYFTDGIDWTVTVTEFNDIDVDALDDTYLRLDCDNYLTTNAGLDIKSDSYGEAAVNLSGKRDNKNNSCATIRFKNSHYDDSDTVNGYITYRTVGDATGYFSFNKDIDIKSNDIYNVEALKLTNPGSIYSAGNERIKFKTSSSDSDGSGIIEIQRPTSSPRRGFAIRGKDTSNADADIFFTYTNSTGGDAINYVGKQTDNSNNLATTKYVKNYVDNNVTGGATNITISRNSTSVTVQSSTGSNGTISAASSSNAGVMNASDKAKLDGMSYKIGYGSGNYFITST